MSNNKTVPTGVSVESFLVSISDSRRGEAQSLITLMHEITGKEPYMWGPSIIGFGAQHYKYESGREGDMPDLAFSPRKASLTIYFSEGFDRYVEDLRKLGKHKQSVSCLYINNLRDIDLTVLRTMLEQSLDLVNHPVVKPTSVDEYIANIPLAARPKFDELRSLVKRELPTATEVLSYGIVGYKMDAKRARLYISGWKDHLAIYPIPSNEALRIKLAPYVKGKGTLWFNLTEPLPKPLIKSVVKALTS